MVFVERRLPDNGVEEIPAAGMRALGGLDVSPSGWLSVSPFSSMVTLNWPGTSTSAPSYMRNGFQSSAGNPKRVMRRMMPSVSMPRASLRSSSISPRNWPGSTAFTGFFSSPK
jgi:hypothetical protein